jgi:Protein of unknown function (DUF3467)
MKRHARQRQAGEELEARYANFFLVGHNAFEVVLEFGQFHEGTSQPQMHTRIIAAPVYAKALLKLLDEAIAKYEQAFGEIVVRGTNE